MLYLYSPDQQDLYLHLFTQALPERSVVCWPQQIDPALVTHAAVWAPPRGLLASFTGLQAIFVMGAGVDNLLQREDIPQQIPIFRLTDAGMAQQMTEYCLYGVLHYQRQMDLYRQQQAAGQWIQQSARLAGDIRVTVLGLGQLGQKVACQLAGMGYRVRGWSRHPRQIDGLVSVHGEPALEQLLSETDVLFSVLPATAETHHLLNAARLALLPHDAAIINAGRGSLIDQTALLQRLDQGYLRFVLLDVFEQEPLAPAHPLWQHPRVLLTPHIAADTIAAEAVRQIVANLHAMESGASVTGLVDRTRGY